jgi:hypothetical protein
MDFSVIHIDAACAYIKTAHFIPNYIYSVINVIKLPTYLLPAGIYRIHPISSNSRIHLKYVPFPLIFEIRISSRRSIRNGLPKPARAQVLHNAMYKLTWVGDNLASTPAASRNEII